jgi:hypothetical protein
MATGGTFYSNFPVKRRPGFAKGEPADGTDPIAGGFARSRFNQGVFDHAKGLRTAAMTDSKRPGGMAGVKSPKRVGRKRGS